MSRASTRDDERGAALVESALIFLPLCLILFGILEYGFVFKDSLTLSSATRAGARTASASPHEAGFYSGAVDAVAKASTAVTYKVGDTLRIYTVSSTVNASGDAPATCSGTGCVLYTWNGTAFVTSRTDLPTLISAQNACLNSAQSVGIALTYSHDAVSGFFHDLQMHEKTVMRLEPDDKDCT